MVDGRSRYDGRHPGCLWLYHHRAYLSFMSGKTTQAGCKIGQGNFGDAAHAALAIVSFVVGSFAGALALAFRGAPGMAGGFRRDRSRAAVHHRLRPVGLGVRWDSHSGCQYRQPCPAALR